MGRPSLSAERRRQIIAATIQCVAVHGVRGATLERIAQMAGMTRGHVRHFVGNRDELLTDAARVFYYGDAALDEKDLAVLATSPTAISDPLWSVDDTLDYLFGASSARTAETAAAMAWVDASRASEAIHKIALSAYIGIEESLAAAIAREHPQTTPAEGRRLAAALLALAIGAILLTDLELSMSRLQDARSSAEALLAKLTS